MNLLDFCKRNPIVLESVFNKVKKVPVKDIEDSVDDLISSDEIKKELIEFIKRDCGEHGGVYTEDLPGMVFVENDGVEYCIASLKVETGYIDGMYTYSYVDLPESKWRVYGEFVDEEMGDYIEVDWEDMDELDRNAILRYLNFTNSRYTVNESVFNKVKRAKSSDTEKQIDDMMSGVVFIDDKGKSEIYIPKNHNGVLVKEGVEEFLEEKGDYGYIKTIKKVEIKPGFQVIGEDCFGCLCYAKLEELILNEGVVRIEENAFGSINVSKITVPSSVDYVGDRAFRSYYLKELHFLSPRVRCGWRITDFSRTKVTYETELPSRFKTSNKYKKSLEFEDDLVSDLFFDNFFNFVGDEYSYYTTDDAVEDSEEDGKFPLAGYKDCVFTGESIKTFNELEYFTGIKSIPDYAFADCSYLESISLPPKVESIEESAFVNCSSLTTVNLPKTGSLKTIGESAFANSYLETVVLPEGVEVIGNYAFSDCDNLKSVVLPSSIKKIGKCAFSDCRSLESIQGLENATDIGEDVLWGCDKLLKNKDYSKYCNSYEDRTIFNLTWAGDWNKIQEEVVTSYILNKYDTDDVDSLSDNEDWQEDEMNPDSDNFDENRFTNYAYEYISWICQEDWDMFKKGLSDDNSWVEVEDKETFSSIEDAIDYCVPDGTEFSDIYVKMEDGGLNVCGSMIYPLSDRSMVGDDLEEFDEDDIDYSSRRFTDRINFIKSMNESVFNKVKKTKSSDIESDIDNQILPKDYIELATAYMINKHPEVNGDLHIKKRIYRHEDEDFKYILRWVVVQEDGLEIGTHEHDTYIELGWEIKDVDNPEENDEGDEDYYTMKDEDIETQMAVYKCVLYNLGETYVDPRSVYIDFISKNESVFNKVKKTKSSDIEEKVDKGLMMPENYIELATVVAMERKGIEIICPSDFDLCIDEDFHNITEISIRTAEEDWDVEYKYGVVVKTLVQDEDEEYGWRTEIWFMEELEEDAQIEIFERVCEELKLGNLNPKVLWMDYSEK